MRICRDQVGAVFDCAQVAQIDRGTGHWPDRCAQQLAQIAAERRIGPRDALDVSGPHIARRHHQAGLADCANCLFRRHAVLPEAVGIECDHDGPLAPTEGRRRRDPRQCGKEGAHAVQRQVLHFAQRPGRAAEDQQAHRHAARIEAGDEGLHGSRRHECFGAVHIADRLRHGLRHVGTLMEDQLHQRRALDALALYVIDARDVEEVILVVIRQEAFHLRRVHPAIGLCDIDSRIAHLWKDIDRHPLDGQNGAKRHRQQSHYHGNRTAESAKNQPHYRPLVEPSLPAMQFHCPTSATNGPISPAATAT